MAAAVARVKHHAEQLCCERVHAMRVHAMRVRACMCVCVVCVVCARATGVRGLCVAACTHLCPVGADAEVQPALISVGLEGLRDGARARARAQVSTLSAHRHGRQLRSAAAV